MSKQNDIIDDTFNDDPPAQTFGALNNDLIDEQEAKLMDWVPFALTKENDK